MSEQIFNRHLLEKACQDFGFWNKLRLLFKPTNYSYDSGSADGDSQCLVKFKELDGKIFVTEIKYTEKSNKSG